MIQTGNDQGCQGLQQRGPVGLIGNQRVDQGGTDVEWEWTKGIHGPLKCGFGGFRGDNVEDQGDSGVPIWWTRKIRSLQAWTREVKARASADQEGEDPGKH